MAPYADSKQKVYALGYGQPLPFSSGLAPGTMHQIHRTLGTWLLSGGSSLVVAFLAFLVLGGELLKANLQGSEELKDSRKHHYVPLETNRVPHLEFPLGHHDGINQ